MKTFEELPEKGDLIRFWLARDKKIRASGIFMGKKIFIIKTEGMIGFGRK